jgi:RimJ/RimL family protein N-acetyltransferase
MKLEKDGLITLNDKNYKYKFFDTNELIDIIRHNKKFTLIYEEAIKKYRNNPKFEIFQLIKEYITYRPDSELFYFTIYNNKEIIFMTRLYYYKEKQYGYLNLVYTNENYRGQGICKNSINFIINKTKKNIKKYELQVLIDNIPAIKCYEYNGFKIIKKIKITRMDNEIIEHNLMRLKN